LACPRLDQLPAPPPAKTGWPWTEHTPQLPAKTPAGTPWPRVSVVSPSYNQGQFIEETIRSVLLQGYPNLEYSILDGGSTDGSLEIIRRYEPWLAYWVSEPDGGQTQAINKGWLRTPGDLLAYINTDDCYVSGALGIAAGAFCARPDVGMVYGTAMLVDQAGNELRTWEAQPFDLRTMLIQGNTVPQPAAFFSRTALETVGLLSEEWQMIMDYEFCIRIGMCLPALCVPRTLARFRLHDESKSRLRLDETLGELLRFITTFRPTQMSPRDWEALKRVVMSRIHYEFSLGYATLGEPERSRAFKQLVESVRLSPLYALRRPTSTVYILKQALAGRLRRFLPTQR
jgi:glycosyltransferase involved in cell wall biosynthesis